MIEHSQSVEHAPSTQVERTITYHTVTLGDLTRDGHAHAEIVITNEQGEQHTERISVPAGLPGERVTVAFEAPPAPRKGKKRNRHWKQRPPRVWITEIHELSPLHVQAPCPVFGECGGCQLQHMRYDAQLQWKRQVVANLLRDVGHFEQPPLLDTVPCDVPWHYRNHMRFSVNRNGQVGLTARGTHRVLPLTHCPIAEEPINRALAIFSQRENARPQVLIRSGIQEQQTTQLLVQPAPSPDVAHELAEAKLDLHTETMDEQLLGETFHIRPSSFFQTNTAQAEKMAQMVLHGLFDDNTQPANEMTVVDAYCGVGTFALLMAQHVRRVIAIEESASAIKDAQWNMRNLTNVEILKGKVEDVLPTLSTHSTQVDGFVIDPPRAGCQRTVLETLVQHPVSRIVYVSCDPSTLARDLDILCHEFAAYRLRSVQPLDMFPHTAHIESVSILERVPS